MSDYDSECCGLSWDDNCKHLGVCDHESEFICCWQPYLEKKSCPRFVWIIMWILCTLFCPLIVFVEFFLWLCWYLRTPPEVDRRQDHNKCCSLKCWVLCKWKFYLEKKECPRIVWLIMQILCILSFPLVIFVECFTCLCCYLCKPPE